MLQCLTVKVAHLEELDDDAHAIKEGLSVVSVQMILQAA